MTVTWTNRVGNSPWIVPLYVIGGLLVLTGITLLAWGLVRRVVAPAVVPGPRPQRRAGRRRRAPPRAHPAPDRPSARRPGHLRPPGASLRPARSAGSHGLAALAIGLTGVAPAGASPRPPPAALFGRATAGPAER